METEKLHFRKATKSDVDLYFKWTNDETVRENSFETKLITLEEHYAWFDRKLLSADTYFYLFLNKDNVAVGQVRIEKTAGVENYFIGISIDKNFRGKSYGVQMLQLSTNDFLEHHPSSTIQAFIKVENEISHRIFVKAGFKNEEIVTIKESRSYKLYKSLSLV